MARKLLSLAFIACVITVAAPVGATFAQDVSVAAKQSSFDAKQTGDIETIVHDYLVQHPEVLLEALDALEAKRSREQVASQKKAIEEVSPALFETPKDTVIGNPDGDVTVVEFFDYNCAYCKRALPDMEAMVKTDSKLRFILKEIPVLGPQSVAASKVSLALRKIAPVQYAAFHQKLLGARGTADEASALAVASSLGVDAAALKQVMDSQEVGAELSKLGEMATTLSISGTPSYVVEDQVLAGAVGLDALKNAVANVRQCGSASC